MAKKRTEMPILKRVAMLEKTQAEMVNEIRELKEAIVLLVNSLEKELDTKHIRNIFD